MREKLMESCDELYEKIKKQDEALLRLLKQGHRELIIKTIKDYLSLSE